LAPDDVARSCWERFSPVEEDRRSCVAPSWSTLVVLPTPIPKESFCRVESTLK
jgi:hypothetical protein